MRTDTDLRRAELARESSCDKDHAADAAAPAAIEAERLSPAAREERARLRESELAFIKAVAAEVPVRIEPFYPAADAHLLSNTS